MPTPRHRSVLRRASMSSTSSSRPQIVRMSQDGGSPDGPQGCAWIADPTRPICVVEGSKRTFLIPGEFKQPSLGGESDGYSSSQFVPMYESESERSSVHPAFDPTLTGITGYSGGGGLDGSDMMAPPEGFYPYKSGDGMTVGDLGPSDDDEYNEQDRRNDERNVDEGELDLDVADFLQLSSADEYTNNAVTDTEEDTEEDDECIPRDTSEATFSRWGKVGVTAFRKRQDQHLQKSPLQNASYPHTRTRGGRLIVDTITHTKKRRPRSRFLKAEAWKQIR